MDVTYHKYKNQCFQNVPNSYWAALIYHHFDFMPLLLYKKTGFCFSQGRFKTATLPLYVLNIKKYGIGHNLIQFFFPKRMSDKVGKIL